MYRDPIQYTATPTSQLQCPVCQSALEVRLAKGRRSGKAFLMVVCPRDGRHFRGFINDAGYVETVLARLKNKAAAISEGGKP